MRKSFKVLAINHGGHDTSAAIGHNGKIVSACEQERFDLVKHSRSFPINAINECLKISKLKINQINEIAITVDYHEFIKKRYLEPAIKDIEKLKVLINDFEQIKSYADYENLIRYKLKYKGNIKFYRHHLCHIASAYFPSGFNKALLISNDGLAENETGMVGIGKFGKIEIKNYLPSYPDSLGLFYSALTFYLGWKHHCDEGIIMGLAPYGDPYAKVPGKNISYIKQFRKIIIDRDNFNYEIDKSWIAYHIKRDTWISEKFIKFFGKKRKYRDPIKQRHKNIAAALQLRLEEIVLNKLKIAKKKYKINKLCIAGGVGLNCSLNGKIAESKLFKEIFVQPASGDSGVAIGAAYLAMLEKNKKKKIKVKKRISTYLGSRFKKEEILRILKSRKVKYSFSKNIFDEVAEHLKKGDIIAWFQNEAEFGPRALGNRSIICRPYPEKMKDYLNKRVKFREYFRPFAPAVLEEHTSDYFNIKQKSPHMLIACKVIRNKKKKIPAVVHVDNTCRVQTVSKKNNLNFYKLIKSFYKKTDCPVILNTSFNVKGQPIINTPSQAIKSFFKTNIDILVLGNYILKK